MSTSFVQLPVTDPSINSKVPLLCMLTGVHPSFVGHEAYTIFGLSLRKIIIRKISIKLGMKGNIYLDASQGCRSLSFISFMVNLSLYTALL
jgi:hypothetical protein